MNIVVVSVGREAADPFGQAVAEYAARVRRFWPVEDVVCRSEKEQQRRLERIASGWVVALDERGERYSSTGFAGRLRQWMEGGHRSVVFVLGGAQGLSAYVRQRADALLSLSPMTLAHRVARLVLFEQLYRAVTIQQGIPYHK